MDLQPLREFIAQHHLETQPAYSLLDIMAELGEVAQELVKATDYGRGSGEADPARMKEKIGDLMFAVAYLSTLYAIDPEAALWESVSKFEHRLRIADAENYSSQGDALGTNNAIPSVIPSPKC